MPNSHFGLKSQRLAKLSVSLIVLIGLGMNGRARAQEDVADVDAKEHQLDDDGRLRYLLISAKGERKAPTDGFKVLVVLPGGDGGAGFAPFVKRIYKHALSKEYVVIQLIAPKWSPAQQIVWPTAKSSVKGAKVPVEAFLAQAVDDVRRRIRIDERYVFTLSWSSGGPAAYATSLTKDTPVTGSFIAMSVFKPNQLPDLARADGTRYYILHSPQDRICPFRMARTARDSLSRNGATVEFAEYPGGHGWRGNVFGNIRAGVTWLEKETAESATADKRRGR